MNHLLFLEQVQVIHSSGNVVDNWFIDLIEKFNGFGMLIYVALTLIISGVLSALIGLERYRMGENAGMRTHALLSIGCSFLMTISIWAIRIPDPSLDYDISRIATGAITGIGFLGAGVIIKDRFTVKGLSTATTLWICSAIGLATGAGFVLESVVATIITSLVVFIRNRVIVMIDKNAPHVVIKAEASTPIIQKINDACLYNQLNLKNLNITHLDEKTIEVNAYFPYRINPLLLEYFMKELKKDPLVIECSKVIRKEDRTFNHTHES